MKKVNIDIKKNNILKDVALNTAYSDNRAETLERVATIECDDALLTKLWKEVCGEVTEKLRSFTVASQISADSLKLELELSGAYDSGLTPSIENDLASAIAAGVTAGWFQFTLHERYEEWERRVSALIERAVSKLCHRLKPVRSV